MLTTLLNMAIAVMATLIVLLCTEYGAWAIVILAMLTGAMVRGVVDRLLLVVHSDGPSMARRNEDRVQVIPWMLGIDGLLVIVLTLLWLRFH